MTVRAPAWETWLRFGVLAGIGLLLLTPFVVSQGTIFPFVVGKAVWSRSVIAVVFALWAVLALANPACRPRRSWVLVALAAGLAVSLLAAGFGASFQRSLWSSYERMQGVVDGAHWMALAVVLVSVLRTGAAWRRLLMASAGAGAAMACLVIARHHELAVPFYVTVPEQHLPRMSGPLGNPTYLGAYMLANLMLALGLAARAWLTPAPRAGHWTRDDQIDSLIRVADRQPDVGFMVRLLALCTLPRTDPGTLTHYVRRNGRLRRSGARSRRPASAWGRSTAASVSSSSALGRRRATLRPPCPAG